MPLIKRGLFTKLDEKGLKLTYMIKRNSVTNYSAVGIREFELKDSTDLLGRVSLKKCLREYKIDQKKRIFPYSLMTDLSWLTETTTFPPIEKFQEDNFSAEKISTEEYESNKKEFESLPIEKRNMLGWLELYVVIDCVSLLELMEKLQAYFFKIYNEDMTSVISVSGLAFRVLTTQMSTKDAVLFSPQAQTYHLTQMAQRGLHGGVTQVFKRFACIGETKINGLPLSSIMSFDANQLYPSECKELVSCQFILINQSSFLFYFFSVS